MPHIVKKFGQNRLRSVLLCCAALSVLGTGAIHAQTASQQPDYELFTGCSDDQVLARTSASPRETIMNAANKTDPKSKLIFKSFSLNQASEVDPAEFAGECWSRLDGLWREQMRVTFNSELEAQGWAGASPEVEDLAHGVYTAPEFVNVELEKNGQILRVSNAMGGSAFIRYVSNDKVALADVFSGAVASKTYVGERGGANAPRIIFDVSRRGFMRLKMGDRTFIRPKPEISEVARGEQVEASDLFAIAYNPKNLRANRQGYDISRQDPNNFLDNGGLLYVFAPSKPRDYYISEQMTVPLGLSLIPEGNKQGMVYFETLVASEYEYQEASRTAFGVGVGLKGKGGGSEPSYDPISLSAGYSNAREQSEAQQSKNSVATINAYQRSKKYALVRDHAYSDLSDQFIDAIYDAYETGDYRRVIDDFGTHYPYAVTYGTAGRLSTYMTEETFSQNRRTFKQDGVTGGFSYGPLAANASYESSSDLRDSNSSTNKYGETIFTAVGGNGSWDQNGFSAGDAPFPILTDMRTLDGLLSPIYFPDQPEIYDEARSKFADAIITYLSDRPALSRASGLAGIAAYEEEQTYRIKLHSLECIRAGAWEGTGNPVQIHGWIRLQYHNEMDMFGRRKLTNWHTKNDTNDDYAEIPCPGGKVTMSKPITKKEFTGTRQQLENGQWSIATNLWEWDWGADAWDGQEHIRDLPSPRYNVPSLNKGQRQIMSWDVPVHRSNKGMPELRINVEFERLE